MRARSNIYKAVESLNEEKKRFQLSDVMERMQTRPSRQYVSTILQEMVASGTLIRQGGGRATQYVAPEYVELLTSAVKRTLRNQGLREEDVLDDIERRAGFLRSLKENVSRIFHYAFLEMLNNAIEHSESSEISIEVYKSGNNLVFSIEDKGIGVFKNVMKTRQLASEIEAMQDILKGKTTTLPEGHSGEGIFFTSRVSDVFILDSYGLRLRVDNLIDDIFYEQPNDQFKGTKVTFIIALESDKSSQGIFIEYATDPAEGGFDKTEIRVKLYAGGSIYVSRSQARRIMDGLGGRFKKIILDYDQVTSVGQAFVDEIYRVFAKKHPEIEIESVNTNDVVGFMIRRAIETER